MTSMLPMVAMLCMTIAATVCLPGAIQRIGKMVKDVSKSVTNTISKNVAAVQDPFAKTVASLTLGHCQKVKNVMGLNHDKERELDLSQLKLDYITSDAQLQYRLAALTQLPSTPKFDPQRSLAIYVHGFIDNPFKASYSHVSDAFIKRGNYNILAFDASSALGGGYLYASSAVRLIGQALGTAVTVMTEAGLNFTSIHLVGHSLGAHIASFAGKTVYSLSGHRVGRITGLDPAGPCFAEVESGLKLNRSDADFVDVIHTNAKVYGLNEQVGHVDYYPNGGSKQPGCLLQSCSHSRVWALFAESVLNPAGFPAVLCDSWTNFKDNNCYFNYTSYMGYASCPGVPMGKYYLQTAENSPYALGDDGINYTNSDALLKSILDKFRWSKDRRGLD